MPSFAILEDWLESLVEKPVVRLLGGHLPPREIAARLAQALEDSAAAGPPAVRYLVRLHPADAQAALGQQPRLGEQLAAGVVEAARQAGLTLPCQPEIIFVPDAGVKPHTVVIGYEEIENKVSETQHLTPPRPVGGERLTPPRAFVIINGSRTLPLTGPVVTIGRCFDNHIILDDPLVSRAHAQLRLRFGHYVIYDLGSTGGTLVNGQPVTEYILRPGDVISLGHTTLIYGEENGAEMPSACSRTDSGEIADTRPMEE